MDPQKTKIMIVDDEENIVLALEYIFTSAGYEVRCFTNGADALEQVGGFAPELVILDVMMPGMDGFAVAKAIRQQAGLEKTNIVFLTARGTGDDKMQGYDAGAEIYVVKPFDNDDLLQRVEDLLTMNF
jgi:DNA-binding response OmpR family regulator